MIGLSAARLAARPVIQPPRHSLRLAQASARLPRTQRSRTMATQADASWVKDDNRRMLHVVYRVGDMDATIEYYKKHFGMQLLRYRDITEDKYSNAFLGYGPETTNFAVELTYNYGVNSYDLGTGFGHFGIYCDDVAAVCEKIKAEGGKVTREAGPVKGGTSVIAFVEDPTGYKWELIQKPEAKEKLCQVMLRVGNLDRSVEFYEKVLGMQCLRKRRNEDYKYTLAFMGYGPEDANTVVELTENDGVDSYTPGDAYAQIAVGTDDVYKTADAIKAAGYEVTREPGPVPGIGTKIVACRDPDGWKVVFVDNKDFLAELE